MTHTPEPWREEDGRIYGFEDGEEVLICDAATEGHALTEFDLANMPRIVACVNACAGVENKGLAELPGGTVAGFLNLAADALDHMRAMRAQRDELAAALRACLAALDVALEFEGDVFGAHHNNTMDAMEAARAALAKAKP